MTTEPDLLGAIVAAKEPFLVIGLPATSPFHSRPPRSLDDTRYQTVPQYCHCLIKSSVFAAGDRDSSLRPALFRAEIGHKVRVIATETDGPLLIVLSLVHGTMFVTLRSRFDTAHPLSEYVEPEEERSTLRRFLGI